MIVKRTCFDFYEIESARPTSKAVDRREFYFNKEIPDEEMNKHMSSTYFIYSYHPVDDPVIRGSCKDFLTRNKLKNATIKAMTLDEVEQK